MRHPRESHHSAHHVKRVRALRREAPTRQGAMDPVAGRPGSRRGSGGRGQQRAARHPAGPDTGSGVVGGWRPAA